MHQTTPKPNRLIDAALLALCVASLVCYLLFSVSASAFLAEAARLAGKL